MFPIAFKHYGIRPLKMPYLLVFSVTKATYETTKVAALSALYDKSH